MEWVVPRDALNRHSRGSLQLPPPTWLTLMELAGFQSLADVANSGCPYDPSISVNEPQHASRFRFPVSTTEEASFSVPVVPVIVPFSDGTSQGVDVCLPGDENHPHPVNPSQDARQGRKRRIRVRQGEALDYLDTTPHAIRLPASSRL